MAVWQGWEERLKVGQSVGFKFRSMRGAMVRNSVMLQCCLGVASCFLSGGTLFIFLSIRPHPGVDSDRHCYFQKHCREQVPEKTFCKRCSPSLKAQAAMSADKQACESTSAECLGSQLWNCGAI